MNSRLTVCELYHGDCVAGMRNLEAESVDVAVTSPPYNLGIRYSQFDDNGDRAGYLKWSLLWAAEVFRVLKPDGALFLNVGAVPANPLLPHQLVLEFSKLFVLQNTLHWIKSISVETSSGDTVTAGHFKPLNSPRFITDCHEFVFQFTKMGNVPVHRKAVGVPYADKSNIGRWGHTGGADLRCRGNNWFVPYETIMRRDKERPHPATFPVKLASMCLKLHGIETLAGGGVVLDPFVGIGHAALAAQECGAGRFIGFDIDEIYLTEAKKRIAEASAAPLQCELLPVATAPAEPALSATGNTEEDCLLPLFTEEAVDARKPAPVAPVAKKKRGRPRKTARIESPSLSQAPADCSVASA